MPRPRFRQFIVAVILMAIIFMAGAGWWFCQNSNILAFLPARIGAQWILDPVPPEIVEHLNVPVKNAFQQRFVLSIAPAQTTLTLCAFKNANIFINGHEVSGLHGDVKNWKQPATVTVTDLLHTGTNEVVAWVTNDSGPPALWLQMQSENFSLSSDATWQVSQTGKIWTPTLLATQPIPIPRWSPIFDEVSTWDAVKKQWRMLAGFLAIALGAVLIMNHQRAVNLISKIKFPPIYILLAVILIGRTALLINDAAKVPDWMSFDQPDHLAYISFIQQHGALPPPDSGAEMHQPPLYYAIAAGTMHLCGFSAGQAHTLVTLRFVNGVFGLIHCWLALLCLRLLFPNNLSAQAVGLLLASLLPPYLYLSVGITNDPLTGLLVTTAFYFLLRAVGSEKETFWPYVGIGLALGAAMLTKLSTLPAVPIFFIALGCHFIRLKKISIRPWLQGMGTVALLCVLVCGWHYFRIWLHTGTLAIPRSAGGSWWQTPGFRTFSYYFNFGQVLISPLFGGLHSFADGIYSTFWGDGMISGATELTYRPPWNYDLMKAAYLLALPLTILAAIGGAHSFRQLMRQPKPEWLCIVGLVSIYLLALVCVTLLGPWQSQVKAFYAIPAFIPACVVIVAGWDWLAKKGRAWRTSLWLLMLVWSLATFASFWINGRGAEFWRSRAAVELINQHFQASADDALETLRLNPDDFEAHRLLANVFTSQKRSNEAVQQYLAALNLHPDSPKILDMFAKMLLVGEKDSVQQAVKLSEHACQLTSYRRADLLTTLALAYANAGRTQAAIATAENARELAQQNADADLVKQNQELIERCRKAKAE